MTNCPCGTGKALEDCCGPYIEGAGIEGAGAPTAVALMRSRYSAYVLGKGVYLSQTLAASQQADFDIEEFNETAGETKWLGLEIRQTTDGGEDDETGTVEFVATYRSQREKVGHHELAKFTRENGRWVFSDCVMNPKAPPRISQKVGRNEPCPCGSGKKFKKCCGA
jgi:SEC-C motif domain protein